jgi:Sugar (and other) transporter
MSFSVFVNFFFAGLLQLLVPQLLPTPIVLLAVFAGLCIVAWVFIFFFVRETKERTLEEINYIFGVRTIRHMQYQLGDVAPYKLRLFKWWLMRGRKADTPTPPPPLYTWSTRRGEDVTGHMDKRTQ